jgi:hypothetical protein
MRVFATVLAVILSAQTCFAWSEGGHHLIAVMAFETLSPDQQFEISTHCCPVHDGGHEQN